MINNAYIVTDHAELHSLFSIIQIPVKPCNRVIPKDSTQVFSSCSTDTLQLKELLFQERPYTNV